MSLFNMFSRIRFQELSFLTLVWENGAIYKFMFANNLRKLDSSKTSYGNAINSIQDGGGGGGGPLPVFPL